jgi:ABC-type transport system involved in multi-copper enzyme maturation permease subunit
MSLLHLSLTSWRRWSSRQAWSEGGAGLALVSAACALWFLDTAVSASVQLLLWCLWVGAFVVLHRLGCVPLFGPVLFYDMVRMGRRKRHVLMRTLYAGFLLLLLVWVYSLLLHSRLDTRGQAARLASDFFETLMLVQVCAVVVLTPAYLGGAVAEEKERRTLEFILATDLSNQEIVLSKLGSRLANLALFLLTGLPILGILQFLGGIDPNLVLLGFAVTGLTMLGVGSVGLLYSVLMRRARDAIASTYLVLLAYIGVAAICWGIEATVGWHSVLARWLEPPLLDWARSTCIWLTEALNAGSPLTLCVRCKQSGMAGTLALTLPGLLREYATFHFLLAGVCLTWAIVRLRAVGLKQTVAREIKTKAASKTRAPVGARPMLWKEMLESKARLGPAAWVALLALAGLTLGIGLWIWIDYLRSPLQGHQMGLAERMNLWARITGGAVACLGLLRAAVRASTSVSGERDQQTLDALITTQLDSDSVLGAKLLGSVLSVRLGFYWLAAILFLGCITGGVHPLAFLLTLAAWLVYAFCFAMLGLFCSMIFSTSTRASVATALLSVGLAIGHWAMWACLGPLFFALRSSGPQSAAEVIATLEFAMSPPCVLVLFMFPWDQVRFVEGHRFGVWLTYSILGAIGWGVLACACWFILVTPQFRVVMRRKDAYPDGGDVAP